MSQVSICTLLGFKAPLPVLRMKHRKVLVLGGEHTEHGQCDRPEAADHVAGQVWQVSLSQGN